MGAKATSRAQRKYVDKDNQKRRYTLSPCMRSHSAL